MFRIFKDKRSGKKNDEQIKPLKNLELKKSLKENISIFKEIFTDDDTIIFRHFETHIPNSIKCCLILADGMTEKVIINEDILLPLMNSSISESVNKSQIIDFLINKVIISDDVKRVADIDQLVGSVLYGDSVLLVDGFDEALIMNTKGWKTRTINEPSAELIAKGPREGFIESILINTSLIRRKIKDPDLKFKFREIGVRTKTNVCICYIDGLANEKILKELEKRLDQINIDGIIASNYIEELISDSPLSPYKTTGYTERPDVVAGKLLEGRFAIIVDGTPVVVTLPFVFMEYFQSNEDYYNEYIFASLNRLLRYASFFITTSIPAIYVALVTFHQEMIPTPLLLSITSARDGVPFPTIVSALGMMFVFEILREAGLRLPEPVGATVSIVGALVLGESAVQARFVSAPIVIVVALTGISAFLIYPMKGAVIVTRVVFVLLAGFLGLYGYIFGVIGLFIHLMSIRSFGIPYMLNMGSLNKQDLKDTAIRAPWWYMYYRPKLIADRDSVRKGDADRKAIPKTEADRKGSR